MEDSQRGEQGSRPFTRRGFVRSMALGVGAVAVVPLLNACGDATPTAATLPTSNSTSAATTAAAQAATTAASAVNTTGPAASTITAPAVINGTVTLTIMGQTDDFSTEKLKPFLDANPNIKIEHVDNDATRFKAMLAAGTPPDIFRTYGQAIPNLALRGIVLDLTNYFKSSTALKPDDLMPPAVRYYTVNGAMYGVVLNWSPDFSLFVSNKALEEASLPIPSITQPMSYTELATLATKLTKKQGDRILRMGYGYEPGWFVRYIQQIMAQKDQHLYKADFSAAVIKDNPTAVAALKYYYDLSKANVTWNPLNPDPSWVGDDMMKDQGSIVHYGYWFTGYAGSVKDSPILNKVTMLPAPIWEGGKRLNPNLGGTGFAIAKATKNPDATWKLYEYYMGGDPSLNYVKDGGGVPPKISWNQYLPKQTPFQQQALASLQEELKYSDFVLDVNPYYDDSVFNKSWTTNLEKSLNGSITFEQLVDNIEKEVNTAITEGKAAIGK